MSNQALKCFVNKHHSSAPSILEAAESNCESKSQFYDRESTLYHFLDSSILINTVDSWYIINPQTIYSSKKYSQKTGTITILGRIPGSDFYTYTDSISSNSLLEPHFLLSELL